MDKESAVVAGSIISTGVVALEALLVTPDYVWAFIITLFFLGMTILAWVIMPFHPWGGKISSMAVREIFWLPFLVPFLTPLWIAIAAIAFEWRLEEPIVHYSAVVTGFVLAIPMLVLHRYLSGVTYRKKESNQPPQPTQVSSADLSG